MCPLIPGKITFHMCRFLMPGIKPYYRLAADGRFIAAPKEIPSGWMEVREKFRPSFSKGIVSLFVYVSYDGETDDPKPYSIQLNNGGKIIAVTIPNIPLLRLDDVLSEYKALFDKYFHGYVKISKPGILKVPTTA